MQGRPPRAAIEPVQRRQMRRKPMRQRSKRRRRRLDRPIAPALAPRDIAHDVVFQHLADESRRGIAAGELMTGDQVDEPLRQHPGTGLPRLVAEKGGQRRLGHHPALLGRERRCGPRACLVDQQQRCGLPTQAGRERGMRQDIVRSHRHREKGFASG